MITCTSTFDFAALKTFECLQAINSVSQSCHWMSCYVLKLSKLKPGCHVVTVSDHPGNICDVRVDRRGVGCTEGVCVSVSLQHPPLPRHTAPNDGLLHCHGESLTPSR